MTKWCVTKFYTQQTDETDIANNIEYTQRSKTSISIVIQHC